MDFTDRYEKQQLDQHELKNTSKNLSDAIKQRRELVNESRSIFNDFYDKILFYSAGAFSFSIALIGLVLKDKAQALSYTGFILPNVYWLYFSLFSYLTVCFLVLISKKFDALYTGAIGAYFYSKKLAKYEKANIDFHSSHQGQVLVKNSSTDEEIEVSTNNLQKAEDAKIKMKDDSDRFYLLKRFCHTSAEILVFIATAILFLFFVQLIQATIWN